MFRDGLGNPSYIETHHMTTTEIHRMRLFWAARVGVAVSAARWAATTAVMDPLKDSFGLNNVDVGWIGGAGFWGFPVTMLVFGSLCDVLGMKLVLRLAVCTYLAGTAVMLAANGFVTLFLGSLLLSMGNGLVQSAANPLVVTLFPERKTEMINKCHLAFAAGMVLFGLTVFGMGSGPWQVKLALVLLPTVIFGGLFAGQGFPATERVQMGVSFGQMFRETFLRPLFLLLAFCMMMTASVELATGTWLTPVLTSAGIPGILVLVWVYLLTAVLRQASGPMLRRFSPPGILLCSAVVSGLGLIATRLRVQFRDGAGGGHGLRGRRGLFLAHHDRHHVRAHAQRGRRGPGRHGLGRHGRRGIDRHADDGLDRRPLRPSSLAGEGDGGLSEPNSRGVF